VPILVALRRPDLIQRRTVSGSRLVRRAASGTVSIVAVYYNNSIGAYSNAGVVFGYGRLGRLKAALRDFIPRRISAGVRFSYGLSAKPALGIR
jgi:hypothetical protein